MRVQLVSILCASLLTIGGAVSRAQDEGGTGPGVPISITGCVMRAADYFKGRPTAEGQQLDRDHFVLTSALHPKVKAGDVPVGTSGSTPSVPSAKLMPTATARVYDLTGDREAELASYIGQRVEIVAQPDPNKKVVEPKAATADEAVPAMTVISFRVVAKDCR